MVFIEHLLAINQVYVLLLLHTINKIIIHVKTYPVNMSLHLISIKTPDIKQMAKKDNS